MSVDPASDDRVTRTATVAAERPILPGYEILEEIGRGGMGVVYKARRAGSAEIVALKMIRDGALAGREQRDRFRIEAEAASRMRHANIVRIFEWGDHEGRPYFVMEFVDGIGLDRQLTGDPWQPARAAELVRTLALAVQHAHDQKIVHRDLKPGNVLLQISNGEWAIGNKASDVSSFPVPQSPVLIPKITDFGLAKRLDADSTAWTVEGMALGTPAYMAPEQAAGRISEIGPLADVYSLGVILYETLTGRPPFRGDSRDGVIQQVLHDDPELPSRLRPDVPRELETVCLQCLEKEPGRRYASARALADDLSRFLEAKPVAAVPRGPVERLTRHAERDGYQIVGEIGRGPRAIVYHARFGRFRQPVTLKVFRAGKCTREEWDTATRQEADRWAGVSHPQVLTAQRAGWWDGMPYLAREYVPQGSLEDKIAAKPWPVPAALSLVEQLATVVAYLHRQGIVHGNLKPANVLLAADGIPRLSDARFAGSTLQDFPSGDESAAAAIAYRAPELLGGQAEPRPHADIYGLGAILYELLTGRPVFSGASVDEVAEQVRTRVPPPPSQFNRDVTPPIDHTCLRCLEKNRWSRHTRAYDLASRLRYLRENL
jgi:serine/threonine protein kinase